MSNEQVPPGNPSGRKAPKDQPKKEYDVGYGKPPRHTQFPPGKSGNPRGRPKGAKGLGSELKAELSERVTITQDGKARRLSKRRVILKALVAKAAKGDIRAADKLLSLIIQMEGFEDQRQNPAMLSDNDRQILDLLLGEEPDIDADTPDTSGTPTDDSEGRDSSASDDEEEDDQ